MAGHNPNTEHKMSLAKRVARKIAKGTYVTAKLPRALQIYRRYRNFTMIFPEVYMSNLLLCANLAPESGCIVEAGVWRGGMSAGMADMLPGRVHYLFDSFEGLPPATELDGAGALQWQADVNGPTYCDNCRAERAYAEQAMTRARAKQFHLVQGWFSETLVDFVPPEPIAILRLDGDWYDSTMQCLASLYPKVMPGGLVIVDDYYTWEGCARALHDYLSKNKIADRIEKWGGVCYLLKRAAAEACR